MKKLLAFLGIISLGLGILGAFLPLLPTTPFVLLSAWLFSRSSTRLHNWMMNHKIFGSLIKGYVKDKSIPMHAKITAIAMLFLSMSYTIFFIAKDKLWLQLLLATFVIGVSIHIATYKTRKKE